MVSLRLRCVMATRRPAHCLKAKLQFLFGDSKLYMEILVSGSTSKQQVLFSAMLINQCCPSFLASTSRHTPATPCTKQAKFSMKKSYKTLSYFASRQKLARKSPVFRVFAKNCQLSINQRFTKNRNANTHQKQPDSLKKTT